MDCFALYNHVESRCLLLMGLPAVYSLIKRWVYNEKYDVSWYSISSNQVGTVSLILVDTTLLLLLGLSIQPTSEMLPLNEPSFKIYISDQTVKIV